MIFSNRSLRGFGFQGLQHLRGFGGLPTDFRRYILDARPENSGETEAMIQNADGLGTDAAPGVPSDRARFPDFKARWSDAVALGAEVDAIRADPWADKITAQESGLAQAVLTALLQARNYYPWGSAWGRTSSNQAGLAAALNSLDAALSRYVSDIGGSLTVLRRLINDREASKAQAIIEANNQAIATANAAQSEARARNTTAAAVTAQQETIRAQASAQALIAQQAEVTTKISTDRAIAKAEEPHLLGLPLSTVLPVAAAGGLGLFLMLRKKSPASGAAPVNGYRRRRR